METVRNPPTAALICWQIPENQQSGFPRPSPARGTQEGRRRTSSSKLDNYVPVKRPIFQNWHRPRSTCGDALRNGQLDDRAQDLRSWRRRHDNAERGARRSDTSPLLRTYIYMSSFPRSTANGVSWRFGYRVRLLFVTGAARAATVTGSGRGDFFRNVKGLSTFSNFLFFIIY